ncbi:iron chelate uptake ABC transporter family permease subunit [Halomonas garicola]|uniref:iron chelate uptake ABC transporter family permease subunit n=1 Tax=Halomonas garicola TaxID=1690008 RepID=UPI002898F4E8|nr:iron chelate uptake ABC transporter family permease subunit [Halomonas garicola]
MSWLSILGDYTFQNVVMGAALLGIISGALGSFAVLRGQSLLGDAISHAALPGVCLGFIVAGSRNMGSIMVGAMITGGLAALLMLALTRLSRLKTDAALGTCLSLFFAIGVVLLTYIQGTDNASQGGLDAFLFGQAAATLRSDVWFMGGITLVALTVLAALWKQAKLVTFDAEFARTLGMPVTLIDVMLTTMITLAVVVGLQMVGVVLMAAMVVAPAVAARQWSRHLGGMVVIAAGVGVISGITGATISTLGRGLATGPLIVLSASAIVLVSLAVAPGRGILWESLRLVRQRWALHKNQILYVLYQTRLEQEEHERSPWLSRSAFTAFALYRLKRQGLLTATRPEAAAGKPARQWRLTPKGVREAKQVTAMFNAA